MSTDDSAGILTPKDLEEIDFQFSDAFSMSLSDNDLTLVYGLEARHYNDGPTGTMRPKIGIIITLQTAKILSHQLKLILERFEAVNGKIPLRPGKLEQIEAAIAEAFEKGPS